MRILFVSMTFPDDPTVRVHGVFNRMTLFVDALKEVGRLDMLLFVEPRIDVSPDSVARYSRRLSEHWGAEVDLTLVTRQLPPKRLSRWEAYGPGIVDGFRQWNFRWANGPRQLRALTEALSRKPDLLFVHRLTAMSPVLRTNQPLPPTLFDLDDIEHVAFRRNISQPPVWLGKYISYLHLPALWWAERKSISLAHRTFVCSEADRRYLSRAMLVNRVKVVPNAVEIHEPEAVPREPTVLFLGSLGYLPNRNAAEFLLREIWPAVRDAVPNAQLVIAGLYPERVSGFGENLPGVDFPGFVEDLAALYRRTRVVCTPILSGGGTRIKILEAAAFAKPVVTTPQGAEGLSLEDGRHLIIRRKPRELAEAVIGLLRDDARCQELGLAARVALRETYDRGRVLDRIRQQAQSALGSKLTDV